jgi:hypothetical protein
MTPPSVGAAVPLHVRLTFGRAALQVVADRAGVDVLHLKGNAVDESLRTPGATGTDVDILVRPSQVGALDSAIRRHGWELYTSFQGGSPFGHAQTYMHGEWGYLDVHRRFPGIGLDDEAAFCRLWEDREIARFCGTSCAVPSVPAQALVLMLNAARAGRLGGEDTRRAWHEASSDLRRQVLQQVELFHAALAFDAARGELERHRGEREYRLWKVVSLGGGRVEEWWARVLAAPSFRAKCRLVGRSMLVNVAHLAHRLGHAPSRSEVIVEFFARPARGVNELLSSLRRT